MNARQRRKVRRAPQQAEYRARLKAAAARGQKLDRNYKESA